MVWCSAVASVITGAVITGAIAMAIIIIIIIMIAVDVFIFIVVPAVRRSLIDRWEARCPLLEVVSSRKY